MTEPKHGDIIEAWLAVMEDVRAVGKDSFNQQQKFKFRGIDAVVNAVGPALRKHGVIVTPELVDVTYGQVTIGERQTQMGHARVTVRYTAHGYGGTLPIGTVPGEAMDVGDKAVAKAMSVAYRIALLQSLTLPTDEPDPDTETYARAPAHTEAEIDTELAHWRQRLAEAGDLPTMEGVAKEAAGSWLTGEHRSQLRQAVQDRRMALQSDAEK